MSALNPGPQTLTGTHFMLGDHACAEGALAAGMTYFGGYPITPSTEIAERLALRLPAAGGHFIQMEDELGSIVSALGASAAGARSMTATSGPGFSLMMESIGLAAMMELPVVIVDVQRASPSTGLPTAVGQSDVLQVRFGSHGDYGIAAYSPSSPQECFDLMVHAFNVADRFRIPVVLLMDEVIGHMTERVVIPEDSEIPLEPRKLPTAGEDYRPYAADRDLVPPMAHAGEGYRIHMTGLTHDERGYPALNAESHDVLVRRLVDKVRLNADQMVQYEEYRTDDADTVVLAYGSTARSAREAIRLGRSAGLKCGLFRPISIWPFPSAAIRRLVTRGKVRRFVVPEINLGQLRRELERLTDLPIERLNHAGGLLITPQAIARLIGVNDD